MRMTIVWVGTLLAISLGGRLLTAPQDSEQIQAFTKIFMFVIVIAVIMDIAELTKGF